MSSKRKIAVITGTRAEYGLLYWVLKGLKNHPSIDLQLLVTGMHLSPEFGLTYKTIEKDGFVIDDKIEMLLSSDTSVGISKSMGLAQMSFAESFERLQPDLILVLGDRFEIFAAVSAAMMARIPVAHIHGGETSEGVVDESIRHSITKMSHYHFVATDTFSKRVIQLGEHPDRVFNFGSPGLDNIEQLDLLRADELKNIIGFNWEDNLAVVTFHPVTLETETAEVQMQELLEALEAHNDLQVIFTLPNADTDGRIIIDLIHEFVASHKERCIAFTSMGQLRYLSALNCASVVIGNSSSGLIEVPSFKIPTINIGDRQKGRIKADSVIDCQPDRNSISEAIRKSRNPEFLKTLAAIENPYGGPGASQKIVDRLTTLPLSADILKKTFYDL